MEIEILNQILALITLILGAALIIYLYDAYKAVKQQSLLLLMYGLFMLVIGIILTDVTTLLAKDLFWIFWSEIFSRLLVIIGICTMIYSILRG
jgi:hypothetical protein